MNATYERSGARDVRSVTRRLGILALPWGQLSMEQGSEIYRPKRLIVRLQAPKKLDAPRGIGGEFLSYNARQIRRRAFEIFLQYIH